MSGSTGRVQPERIDQPHVMRQELVVVGRGTTTLLPFDVLPEVPSQTTAPNPVAVYPLALRTLVLRLVDHIDEIEEDNSEFASKVEDLILRYGSSLTLTLGELHSNGEVKGRPLSEVLRVLGDADHPGSHAARFWFLAHCLSDDDSWVRSGAALGLAGLQDPNAVPSLERQAKREEIGLLRDRLLRVASYLSGLDHGAAGADTASD